MMTADLKSPNRFHPLKFAMWLAMASIIMLFAALTSAYIVRKAQGNWVEFRLPSIFWINTVIILISSVTMQWAANAFKKYRQNAYRLWLVVTFMLGTAFLVGQYIGWLQLDEGGIHLKGNPSGSFVYVISGVHAAHILGGVLILFVSVIRAFFVKFNPNRLVNVQIMSTYWHFVDVLWIYLFIFFQINLA
jgi:cytochrome c oxidase subunit III